MANPVDRTDGPQKFQQFYAVKESDISSDILRKQMSRIKQDVINHGFDPNLLTGWDTVSKNPQTGKLDDQSPAYENDFDTRNGLLVASSNFREWDTQRQLPWSELMFQTWQVVQADQQGQPISNLRAVVRKEVEGPGAQAVLKSLYSARGLTMNKGDATWYQWSEEHQPYFFYALLGIDNVKGVIWLLNDHPNALGKKEITDIWTRWEKRDPDIWINLGPAEWLKYLNPTGSSSHASASADRSFPSINGSLVDLPIPRLGDADDPRFSMKLSTGETRLPVTPVLMNAVELSARYAEMDYLSRVPQRHGIVLPDFPQVEIAVVPAAPAQSVEVRLLMYSIYGTIIAMIYGKKFYETEVEVSWEGKLKAYLYFTLPLDTGVNTGPDLQNSPLEANGTEDAINALFDWTPIYKPQGVNLPPNDVFLLALGAIKTIAPFSINEQIPWPFHVGSELVDANMQVYFENRRQRRPTPPYFRYSHALEAARRIPGWQLTRRRFAEFFCQIYASQKPVGVVLIEKGPFVDYGAIQGQTGNLSTS
ncbi:MAG: hypothetical protein Q9220_003648 [cf. Caloplaca sp. 1 TL-2023]